MPVHNGIVLGPNSPARGLRRCRSEKDEQQLCDDLIAKISSRDEIVSLSQFRASHVTEGLPDRRYRVYGIGLWWETKAADGQLTYEQHRFLLSELSHGALGGCGTLEDLQRTLVVLQRLQASHYDGGARVEAAAEAAKHCVAQITAWAQKGFRTPKKSSRVRRRR